MHYDAGETGYGVRLAVTLLNCDSGMVWVLGLEQRPTDGDRLRLLKALGFYFCPSATCTTTVKEDQHYVGQPKEQRGGKIDRWGGNKAHCWEEEVWEWFGS